MAGGVFSPRYKGGDSDERRGQRRGDERREERKREGVQRDGSPPNIQENERERDRTTREERCEERRRQTRGDEKREERKIDG